MSIQLNQNGVIIQTYDEIYQQIAEEYRAIYGNDIIIDADTPDGQRIGIEAKARLDMQVYLQSVYNQLDPDFATGLSLEKLIKFSGITRRPASISQVDVTIEANNNLTLPSDYKVEDDLNQIWKTNEEIQLLAGTNNVTLFSENFGSISASPGTVNNPVTIIQGVLSVTNDSEATVGTDEETDQELRLRRNRSTQNPATSTLGGIFSSVGNVSNVTDLRVYENDTDDFDPILQLDAHSIWIVAEGGSVSDIAEAIAKSKTGGTGLKGEVIGTYEEEITIGDITFNKTHTLEFDRPVITDVFLRVDLSSEEDDTINTSLIRKNIAETSFQIGKEIAASKIYGVIYRTQDNITATDLEISLDGSSYVDTKINSAPDGKFRILEENIQINLI